jgi:hypothetical protein
MKLCVAINDGEIMLLSLIIGVIKRSRFIGRGRVKVGFWEDIEPIDD